MKKIISSALLFLLPALCFSQNVGIGTTIPHTSAALDISSTNNGLLAPRMTSAQRSAIASPAKGLLVYDTDLNALYHFNGSGWASVGGGTIPFTLPYGDDTAHPNTAFSLTNTGSGEAIVASKLGASNAAIQGQAEGANGIAVKGTITNSIGYGIYGTISTGPVVVGVTTRLYK